MALLEYSSVAVQLAVQCSYTAVQCSCTAVKCSQADFHRIFAAEILCVAEVKINCICQVRLTFVNGNEKTAQANRHGLCLFFDPS